jgi:hypothetical protein
MCVVTPHPGIEQGASHGGIQGESDPAVDPGGRQVSERGCNAARTIHIHDCHAWRLRAAQPLIAYTKPCCKDSNPQQACAYPLARLRWKPRNEVLVPVEGIENQAHEVVRHTLLPGAHALLLTKILTGWARKWRLSGIAPHWSLYGLRPPSRASESWRWQFGRHRQSGPAGSWKNPDTAAASKWTSVRHRSHCRLCLNGRSFGTMIGCSRLCDSVPTGRWQARTLMPRSMKVPTPYAD